MPSSEMVAGGAQQRSKHFDGCGLPCPVGAKEGEDLAGRYVERDIVDGGERAKGFYEVLHTYHASDLRSESVQASKLFCRDTEIQY